MMKSKEQIEKMREYFIGIGTSETEPEILKKATYMVKMLNWVLDDED